MRTGMGASWRTTAMSVKLLYFAWVREKVGKA
jgi:hypothetical protein